MRYLIASFGDRAVIHTRSPEWIEQWMAFLVGFTDELTETGELLQAESLDEAQHATIVQPDASVAAGTIAGTEATLRDFWIVSVEQRHRAEALAARIAEALGSPVEVRGLPDASSIPP